MMLSRRDFMASSSAVALMMALPEISEAAIHGSAAIPTNAPVVVNFGGAVATFFTNAVLNMAKLWVPTSSMVGWPGILDANGYPTGNITTSARALLYPDPAYYGHYLLSWTDSGGSGIIGGIASTAIVYASNVGSTGEFLNYGVQSSGRGVSIEYAYGFFIKAVGTDGSGNIKFTTTGFNYAYYTSTGMTFKFNNLTYNGGAFPAGPNADGSWTINTIDFDNISLQGSSSLNPALIALNTSGTAGVNSEAIYSVVAPNVNPYMSGNWTSSNASNLIWCKKADLSAINSGLLVTQAMATTWKNLSPAYIRFMDWLGTQQVLQPDYARRTTPSSRHWGISYTPPAYWAGVMTNVSDTFTCPTNPPASSGYGSAYVDGEVVIAQVSTTGTNTTMNPKLRITGRAAAAPIYNNGSSLLNLIFGGTPPPNGTNITLTFTGGGLASPYAYVYQTSATGYYGNDNSSLNVIVANIRDDLQVNRTGTGHNAPLIAKGIICQNPSIPAPQSSMSFWYNQNINSSGAAQLGAGFSMTANDPTSNVTFTFGFMQVGYLLNNAICAFTYSALLQGWTCCPGDGLGNGGVIGHPPLEYLAELCARAGSGLWLNIGLLESATTIYNKVFMLAQANYNGQPAISNLALEWGNETWNGGEALNSPTNTMALSLGLGSGYSAHGLRTIQMAQQATAAWAAAGRSRTNLKIVNAYWFGDMNSAGTSATSTQRFNGIELNASGTGTNVTLKAYGGLRATSLSTNYSIAPNRPVDWSDWVAPAPYWQGAEYSATAGGLNGGVLANYNASLLAAYNYAYGNSTQQQAALDFLSNSSTGPATSGDMYNGTLAGVSNKDISVYDWSLGSGSADAGYLGIGTIAASYDTSRSSTGTSGGAPGNSIAAQAKLGVACYEGGLQSGPVFSNQLISSLNGLGYTNGYSAALPGAAAGPSGSGDTSTTAAANLYNLFIAWKNDARYYNLVQQQFNQFRASVNVVSTRDAYASWYGFQGPNIWAMWVRLADQDAPFQVYNAIAAWR